MNQDLKRATAILKKGGIVIFPTDTVFGIGVRIDKKDAVEKLIKIRGREKLKPFPILVENLEMAKKYLKPFDRIVKTKLMDKYWPGGLTIVLNCKKDKVNPLIRGNKDTLGIRIPNHDQTLALIKGVGVPIIGSSANFLDDKTPLLLKDINPKLINLVDYVLDGKCGIKKQSTVIDCSRKTWKILRQGAVSIKILKVELFIDTSSNEYLSVGIKIENKLYLNKKTIDYQKAQAVLPMIKEMLQKHKLGLEDLSLIKINQGPGSFTGLRVGISVANTLSHFLKIPINDKKTGELLEPIYK